MLNGFSAAVDSKAVALLERVPQVRGVYPVRVAYPASVLVSNTIRLSLFARKREVEVMKLVGATDWFIRWPFVIEGVIVGALGGGDLLPVHAPVGGARSAF